MRNPDVLCSYQFVARDWHVVFSKKIYCHLFLTHIKPDPSLTTTTPIITAPEVIAASVVTTAKVGARPRATSVVLAVLSVTKTASMTETTSVTKRATMAITTTMTVMTAVVPAAVLELVLNTTQSSATEGTEADPSCCGPDGNAPLVLLGRGIARLSRYAVLLLMLGRVLSLLGVTGAILVGLGAVMSCAVARGADVSTSGGSTPNPGGREAVLCLTNHLA